MTREEAIERAKILKALIGISETSKILNTFISQFERSAVRNPDGMYYIYGNFNLGGTVSGRLSSSNPNLQNIPSGSKYAKLIKACFTAPPGWIMVGADFASLEDRISALQTKDPNKLKVYTDGYDGHCLRAFSYFEGEFPGIIDTVESINSIEDLFPKLRQDSKGPTFALTYQGTWKTLMNNLGLSEDRAKQIEDNYHKLYKVSDDWVQEKMLQASKDGFTELAFGLRLRTPILAQTILGNRATPYAAAAEGRTMGNALGQSYGMLNNRAAIELRERQLSSKHAMDIRPILHIHDAQYFLVREDLDAFKWLNDNLIECMEWQDDPAIAHDTVKLGGGLETFYPSWASVIKIPNKASKEEILETINAKPED